MLPIIALIGQKNVGKSTLFNKLTHTHDALISNYPGLTRDRQYGYFQCKQFKSVLIDTGGITKFSNTKTENIQHYVTHQTTLAMQEADILLFIMDRQSVGTSISYDIFNFLKKIKKTILVVVNKIDAIPHHMHTIMWDYCSFSIKNIIFISAIHGHGIDNLLENISSLLISKGIFFYKSKIPERNINSTICQNYIIDPSFNKKVDSTITVAVVGRPNSGKSTFVNHILGKNRMITCSSPGTTRNCIHTPIIYNKQKYTLIDTAGVQKIKKIDNVADQISILKTFQIIKTAHILLFIGDVTLGISDQDLHLLQFIINNGKILIIVINKWDEISPDLRNITKKKIFEKINFVKFVQIHFISALYGNGIKALFQTIKTTSLRSHYVKTINTAYLIRILYAAIDKYPPPLLYGKRIKPKYIHIRKHAPLTLVIHGTHVSKLPDDYKRYLKKYFYRTLNITGILLRMQFKDNTNPFINR